MKVVGTMFFENEKLLIDKPRKRPTYQMIGGKVEDGETTLQAAIRECHEELGDEAIFDEEKFELIMEFDEIATSDGITPIHFYVYKYNGKLQGILKTLRMHTRFPPLSSSMHLPMPHVCVHKILNELWAFPET